MQASRCREKQTPTFVKNIIENIISYYDHKNNVIVVRLLSLVLCFVGRVSY
jgi:hypothetical protein